MVELLQQDIQWFLQLTELSQVTLAVLLQVLLLGVSSKDQQNAMLVGVSQVVLFLFVLFVAQNLVGISLWCTLISLSHLAKHRVLLSMLSAVVALWVHIQADTGQIGASQSLSVFSWCGLLVSALFLQQERFRHPVVMFVLAVCVVKLISNESLQGVSEVALWLACGLANLISVLAAKELDKGMLVKKIPVAVLLAVITIQPVGATMRLPVAYVHDITEQSRRVAVAVVAPDEIHAVQSEQICVVDESQAYLIDIHSGDTVSREEVLAQHWFASSRSGWKLNASANGQASLAGYHSKAPEEVQHDSLLINEFRKIVADSTWLEPINCLPLAHVVDIYSRMLLSNMEVDSDTAFAELASVFPPSFILRSSHCAGPSGVRRIAELFYLAQRTKELDALLAAAQQAESAYISQETLYHLLLIRSRSEALTVAQSNVFRNTYSHSWAIAIHENELSLSVEHDEMHQALRYAHLLQYLYLMQTQDKEIDANISVPDWSVMYKQLYASVHNKRRF